MEKKEKSLKSRLLNLPTSASLNNTYKLTSGGVSQELVFLKGHHKYTINSKLKKKNDLHFFLVSAKQEKSIVVPHSLKGLNQLLSKKIFTLAEKTNNVQVECKENKVFSAHGIICKLKQQNKNNSKNYVAIHFAVWTFSSIYEKKSFEQLMAEQAYLNAVDYATIQNQSIVKNFEISIVVQ